MENYAVTHKNIPIYVSTHKRWWEFWKPNQIQVIVNATVNRDLGIAITPTSISYQQ